MMLALGERRSVDTDWQAERGVLGSNRYMLENQVACDVTFYVGKLKQEVTAHKYVLVSRSCVFYAMLCGPLQETGQIGLPDIEPDVFQQLLRFMYYEAFDPNGDSILGLLYAAKKYAVNLLVKECINWLKDRVTVENVCDLFHQAQVFYEKDLSSKCLEFIMKNGRSVLQHLSFRNLSSDCVDMIIKQDGLCAQEEKIYEAVKDWAQNQCARRSHQLSAGNMREVLGGLQNRIRYTLMDKRYFADKVAVDAILTSDEKLYLCRSFLGSDNLGIQTARKPMFQPMRRVLRFYFTSARCSAGPNKHAIKFRFSRKVLLMGIVIYGAIHPVCFSDSMLPSASFASEVKVQLLDKSKCSIVSMTNYRIISEEHLQEILFDKPVALKTTWYTITLQIESPGLTSCGLWGEKCIRINDGVFIKFRNSSLSTNQTTVSMGQIPGLCFAVDNRHC